MFEWDHLRIILAIHRGGSMAAAAESLGIDRATVLRRLDAVEGQLNARLFDRGPDGCVLTASGAKIIDQVQDVELVVTALQHRVEGDERRTDGTVKVSGPAFLLDTLLAPAVPLLRALHPNLHLDLQSDIDALDLARGEVDLALRLQRPAHPATVARKVGSVAVALFASDAYLAQRGAPGDGLDGHDLLLLVGPIGRVPAMGWLLGQTGQANVLLQSHDIATLAAATRAGAGIACLPVIALHDAPGVRAIAPGIVGRFDIYLATHRDLRDRARVKATSEFIVRLFARHSAALNGSMIEHRFAASSGAVTSGGSDR